jgi:hypothetical protein
MSNAVPQVLKKPFLFGVILNKPWACLPTDQGPVMVQLPPGALASKPAEAA